MKAAVIVILFLLGVFLTVIGEGAARKIPGLLITCIAVYAINISSGLFTNSMDKILEGADSQTSAITSENGNIGVAPENKNTSQTAFEEMQENQKDSISEMQDSQTNVSTETQASIEKKLEESQENMAGVIEETQQSPESTIEESQSLFNSLPDISSETFFDGTITETRQVNQYYYSAPTNGTYRFHTNLTSGAEVRVRVCGENGSSIDDGINALTIDLEAGKKYILCIEDQNGPCDYTVTIGVPMAMMDITGQATITGQITYRDQKDTYYYTAETSGSYHFDTDLTSGAEVRIRISGENGKSIDYDTNDLTIDLEAGKNYIVSVEYQNGPCNYLVTIGTPIAITDATGQSVIYGQITYQDQKNKYFYTASTEGTYRFDTDLTSGAEVRIRISGENGKSIDYDTNALTINLEAGKRYIIGVEYQNGPCDYTVTIGVPMVMVDITNQSTICGQITYRDQKDKYFYIAPTSGTYRFDTDLTSGADVRVRVSGENGKSIKDDVNALTINLEGGKSYIISIEYRNSPCDYTVSIGVPTAMADITNQSMVEGQITYQGQKDNYYYTAPTSGTYQFDTELASDAEVCVRVSGENGKSLKYRTNTLSVDLEEGQNYIISVEYKKNVCDYTVYIFEP